MQAIFRSVNDAIQSTSAYFKIGRISEVLFRMAGKPNLDYLDTYHEVALRWHHHMENEIKQNLYGSTLQIQYELFDHLKDWLDNFSGFNGTYRAEIEYLVEGYNERAWVDYDAKILGEEVEKRRSTNYAVGHLEKYERTVAAGFGPIGGGLGYQAARKEWVTNSWFYCNERAPELIDKRYLPQYFDMLEGLVQSFKQASVKHVDRCFAAHEVLSSADRIKLPSPDAFLPASWPNPYRPFSAAEVGKRGQLIVYLDQASEDELIENILLPLFRQLGFQRITAAGHKDKALEFGKDIWMKFVMPTRHVLYFGIQAKKDKLDSAGVTKLGNANVAEIHNQVLMMLGSEIFDAEVSSCVLVDHAFIVAGGEITKAARLWIGEKLDASKRSQIMFMDREDILNLYVVTDLAVPEAKLSDGEAVKPLKNGG